MTKKFIIELLGRAKDGNTTAINTIYEWFMVAVIIVSLLPLMTMKDYEVYFYIELSTTGVFILDYIFRWSLAEMQLRKGKMSYILYPFTPMAIIDMLSIRYLDELRKADDIGNDE